MLVTGGFEWTVAGRPQPPVYSYSGVLTREDGVLRIRLEDESAPCPRSE